MEKTSTKKKPTAKKEATKKTTTKKPVAAKKTTVKKNDEKKTTPKKKTTTKKATPKNTTPKKVVKSEVPKTTTKKSTTKKTTPKKVVKKEASKTTKKPATKKATTKKTTPKKKTTTKKVVKESAPKTTKKKSATKKTTSKKTTTKKKTTPKKRTTKKKESLEKKAIDSVIKYFLSLFSVFLLFTFLSIEISNTIEPKQVQAKEKETEQKVVVKKTGYNISKLQEEYKNSDIIAYLELPDVMAIPIVKTYDNSYYLTHKLDHSVNSKGTPFMDYRVKEGDKKILIYGHSAYDYDIEMPFRQLYKFDDLEFYKEHPRMYLYFKEKKYTYDIFAIYLEKKDFDYVNINSFNGLTWKEHIEKLKNKSKYIIPIELNDNSKILILQTCRVDEQVQGGQYKLVIGVQTKEEANIYD